MFCPNRECPDLETNGLPAMFTAAVSACPACGSTLVASVPSWATPSTHEGSCVPCMTLANAALLPHVKGILDGAGVRYFVKNDLLQNLLGWGTVGLGYSNVFGPPVVMVDATQLDLARRLLRSLDAPSPTGPGSLVPPSGAATDEPSRCSHCGNELEADGSDEPLTHCYHCGWPLQSA